MVWIGLRLHGRMYVWSQSYVDDTPTKLDRLCSILLHVLYFLFSFVLPDRRAGSVADRET